MNDDFEEMARISAANPRAELDARIERELRLQTRARRARRICRYVVLIGGLGGIGIMYLGAKFEVTALAGLGCFLLVPTMIAAIILFVLGGLAPSSVRRHLSERERDLLDD